MDKIKELIEIGHGETAQYAPPYRVGGNCIRTYRMYYLEPTIMLNIRMWLRPGANTFGKDQLIMYGETPGSDFAFAIELTKENKLRFKWKSSKDATPHETETRTTIDANNWYIAKFQA